MQKTGQNLDEIFRRDDGLWTKEVVTGTEVRAYSPEIFRRQNWPDLVSETELGQLGNQLCSYLRSLGRNQKQCTNEVILNLRTLFRVLHWGTEGNLLGRPFTSFFPNHHSISILLQTSQKRPLCFSLLLFFSLLSYYTLLFTVFNVRWRDDINLCQLKNYLFRKENQFK